MSSIFLSLCPLRRSISTVNQFFFVFEFTLTVEIDPLFFTVDRIDHLNQPYFPVGEWA